MFDKCDTRQYQRIEFMNCPQTLGAMTAEEISLGDSMLFSQYARNMDNNHYQALLYRSQFIDDVYGQIS